MFDWEYRKLFNLLTMFTLKTHVIEIKSSSIIKTSKQYLSKQYFIGSFSIEQFFDPTQFRVDLLQHNN
ncbi:hypothetical protein BpHYR1_040697 [Brachionus plicatilis]|uniref:Uncharacterized protein n=1 Tax=Brachionus plicatilis TaxID=10195 RepID=A0A3M7RZE0_BRAPC|nr:hypothetical protein BpHYR1_040697 [Brachionus plicatilis]